MGSEWVFCRLILTGLLARLPDWSSFDIQVALSADQVAKNPAMAARLVVDMGIRSPSEQEHLAMAFNETPYDKWRHYNPEDTIRFYALRLKELGLTKYAPNDIIAQNTNWSFLNELKGELGMTW